MEEKQQQFKKFKFRLKTIGRIMHHDRSWKKIFEAYNLKWEEWWNEYCDGFHNLTGLFEDDIQTDWEKEQNVRRRFLGSIFSEEIEDLFIQWLYYGKKEDLLLFHNWFREYMNSAKEQGEKERKGETKMPKKEKESGYIYVLKSKNLYKIGRAQYPKERIKTYRTENPFGVKVILQEKVKDYIGTEQKLLKKFKDKKIRGEWFKLSKKDVEVIKNYLCKKKKNS